MFGLFLKTAKPRQVVVGAVALFAAAGLIHWAGTLPATEPVDERPTGSVAVSATLAAPVPVPRPDVLGPAKPLQLAVSSKSTAPIHPAHREFVAFDSRDMGGGDYAMLSGVSRNMCETRCVLDKQCLAYTFNKWEGACFLKSSLSDLRLDPRGITGVVTSARVDEDSRPPIIQKVASRRLEGEGYEELRGGFGKCAAACLADDRCAGFNLPAGTKACSLIASIDRSVGAPGTTTGLKMQLARQLSHRERRPPWPPADMPPEVADIFGAMINHAIR
jgi:hypothetical protein